MCTAKIHVLLHFPMTVYVLQNKQFTFNMSRVQFHETFTTWQQIVYPCHGICLIRHSGIRDKGHAIDLAKYLCSWTKSIPAVHKNTCLLLKKRARP